MDIGCCALLGRRAREHPIISAARTSLQRAIIRNTLVGIGQLLHNRVSRGTMEVGRKGPDDHLR